jgi:amidase
LNDSILGQPWADLDATAQAALVARGEVTPRELVAAACERIERVDVTLRAVPVRLFEQALSVAEKVDPTVPFAAVPFLMKDVGARQAGQPYYAGNRALRDIDYRADEDTLLGARFRELGLITVGNSSAPEFGLQSSTWPLAYGPTRNPWDPTRSPGGSSGGACAAVAAGLVPVAHASDGAGSIRIPASWCGLVGLKPTRDRVLWRHVGQGRRDIEFIVARSLRDTAAFLDLLQSPAARGAAPGRFANAVRRPSPKLRVGLCVGSPAGDPVHPDCVRAATSAASALASQGHTVEEAVPDTLRQYQERALHGAAFGFVVYQECLQELEERLGRVVEPEDVEPFLWKLARLEAPTVADADLARAVAWDRDWVARTLAWFEDFDLLVTPTVSEPAPTLESLDPHRHEPLELLEKMVLHMAFTEPWNATGQPAISLPLGRSEQGLPIGVQLIAAPEREEDLFSISAALLSDTPGFAARPPIHA